VTVFTDLTLLLGNQKHPARKTIPPASSSWRSFGHNQLTTEKLDNGC